MTNISFGHKIIIDSGASKPSHGSLKLSILSDETNAEIYSYNGVLCPEGFRRDEDYIEGFARQIADSFEKSADKISKLSPADRDLTGVVIYAPGAIVNNFNAVITNLKKLGTNEAIKNIDYNKISAVLRNLLAAKGGKLSDGFRLMATNDMIGAGASIAQHLVKKGDFQEGYSAAYLMSGGGLGVGQIEHNGEDVLIKSSESGHISVFGTNKSLEEYGASVRALINNFAKEAGLRSEDSAKLVKLGNAKIIQPVVIASSAQEAKALSESGLFDTVAENKFKLRGISDEVHGRASFAAIQKFIEAISIIGANKVNEGVNAVVLTGPLSRGIEEAIGRQSALFGNKNLNTLLMEKITSLLDDMGKNVAKIYDFKLITDIDVPSNNIGGSLVLQGRFIGGKTRGNWLSIPTEALKKFKKV